MRRVEVDLILSTAALFLLSACGTQTERTLVGQPLVVPTPVVVVTPTPTPSPTSTSAPFDSAYAFSFQVTGQGAYTTGAINTDNLLVIKVNAGPAGQISVPGLYSNFTANYNCVSYNITVGGRTVTTQTLKVPNATQSWYTVDQCPNAPSSQIINFSDRASPGHGDMFVTVSNARYDFYCELFYQGLISGTANMYCPLRTAYQTHTLTGTIDVQVNGTIF